MKFTKIFVFLAILVLGFTTAPAFADNIGIQNFSFETSLPPIYNVPGVGTWNNGPIPGWTITGGVAGSWQPGSTAFSSAPDGSMVAFSNGGSISQVLSSSLAANTLYTLSVGVGNRLDAVVNNLGTTYIIQLFAGNTLLNSTTGSNTTIPLGTFFDASFNYVSGVTLPAGDLSIVLNSVGAQTDFDNVRLVAAPVPEPGSLALLAAALGLALFVFRRR